MRMADQYGLSKKHVCKVLVCLHVVLGSELEFDDAPSKKGLVIFGG